MRVRRIDQQGDWTLGQSRHNYASGAESTAQRVKTRLQSFQGDWFLDLEHGLPWLPAMERPANLARLEEAIKHCILQTEGVQEIVDFQLSQDNETRRLVITVSLRASQGETLVVTALR